MVMQLWSDRPERLGGIFAAQVSGQAMPIDSLPQPLNALWPELAGDRMPQVLHAPDLDTPFWSHLLVVDEAPGSQFDTLQEFLRSGASLDAPVACLALAGQRFHGQRGRHWTALRGNLHLSAAVPIHASFDRVIPALTMIPAVAVVDAVREVLDPRARPEIKWVNDVLIAGRKVAGVLTATLSKQRTVDHACFGIGVNVQHSPEIAPTPFVPAAGCLRDQLEADDPELLWRLLAALLGQLEKQVETLLRDGPTRLLARYRASSLVVGRQVRIFPEHSDSASPGTALAEGVVESLNDDLSLNLRGRPEPVCSGRLVLESS